MSLEASELITTADGRIYHLELAPEHLADTIITVGDPNRVEEITRHFDSVEHKVAHREFITHTGYIGKKRISVLSTGIGTDNIDIVFNELDALANIDFGTKRLHPQHRQLTMIRLGTSGAVQPDIAVDSILISAAAIGLDGLLNYYAQGNNNLSMPENLQGAFPEFITPYYVWANPELLKHFGQYKSGITITASGFYGPQGRQLRIRNSSQDFIETIAAIQHNGLRVTNLEMETAGIYGLGLLMGHRCLSVNAILANRAIKEFSKDPAAIVDKMILETLELISTL
jgi:uridine phosphorylase